jgi:quinol-cytochrome oxidoreductase complex cytochrome b subunit
MKTNVEEPPIAGICSVIAWLQIVLALLMGVFAVTTPPGPGMLSFILTIVALLLSSVIWFVLARVIWLLAEIAHNTRP